MHYVFLIHERCLRRLRRLRPKTTNMGISRLVNLRVFSIIFCIVSWASGNSDRGVKACDF